MSAIKKNIIIFIIRLYTYSSVFVNKKTLIMYLGGFLGVEIDTYEFLRRNDTYATQRSSMKID
ncbi:MAG TPA: hypothetical protein P5322_13140, partial [Spirochaetota bacterium]|nr:hypothetical protein [Spirochaetota bacterium]